MNLGSLFGKLGGGIKKGIGKLGEMEGAASGGGMIPQLKRPMPMTPGINPNAPMPELKGGGGGWLGKAREALSGQTGQDGLINRSEAMPNQLPTLQRPEAPTLEPIRDSVNISASNSGPIGGSDTLGSLMDRMANRPAAVENQQTQMLAQRPIGEVRPPDFLGRKGATMEDTPLNHERFKYQTQYMQDGKVPRRWQDIAANSLHGAAEGFKGGGGWEGALGGAAAGGIGSAIDPLRARDFRFNKEQMPRLQADRAELERGQDRSFEMQKRGADLAGTQARTQATIAGTKDAELERRKTDSLIKLNEAKRQAVASGQAKVVEIEDENGQIRIVRVNNDGSVDLGSSGRAAMNQDRIESREKISGNQIGSREKIAGQQISSRERIVNTQQRGATGRTGMTQAGQDRRQKERLAAGGEYIPPVGSVPYGPPADSPSGGGSKREQFIQKAIEAGHSRAAAEAEATKRKY